MTAALSANAPALLREKTLFRQQCHIDGEWVDAGAGGTMAVRNPADGSLVGTVPHLGAADTRRAIAAAHAAGPRWRGLTARQRGAILQRWCALLLENLDDLALLLTLEEGKPLKESRTELEGAAAHIEWFAEEGKRTYGDTIPSPIQDRRMVVIRQPIGVCAAVTPWNFPASMVTRKAAPALAAGCTMVLKPAPQTPFSALALCVLAERAGVPRGVFNVVTGDAQAIGAELTANPQVRKLTFTGSTRVGALLMAQCAGTVKKVSLELGGNAPFIVFDDANLDAAVDAAIASKFRNTGQTCVCANRLFIQDGIYDEFAARLRTRVEALKVGDGLGDGVTQGPLIDLRAVQKVEAHIEDAVLHGARVLTGGHRHPRGGTFFEPTVLLDATSAMKLSREETFGPVAPLYRFHREDDVIALANDTEYGLASYVFSRDMARIWRVAEALEVGIVGVNVGGATTEVAPFGGMKSSGIGREGSRYGIEEFMELKYICLGGMDDGAPARTDAGMAAY
jgi:succinate-semialdehyde dehydrogenase/glutarate-semialdehyde dehydrogenase